MARASPSAARCGSPLRAAAVASANSVVGEPTGRHRARIEHQELDALGVQHRARRLRREPRRPRPGSILRAGPTTPTRACADRRRSGCCAPSPRRSSPRSAPTCRSPPRGPANDTVTCGVVTVSHAHPIADDRRERQRRAPRVGRARARRRSTGRTPGYATRRLIGRGVSGPLPGRQQQTEAQDGQHERGPRREAVPRGRTTPRPPRAGSARRARACGSASTPTTPRRREGEGVDEGEKTGADEQHRSRARHETRLAQILHVIRVGRHRPPIEALSQ